MYAFSFVRNRRRSVVNSPAVLRSVIILTIRHRHLPTTSNNHFSQEHLVPFPFHIECRVSSTSIACSAAANRVMQNSNNVQCSNTGEGFLPLLQKMQIIVSIWIRLGLLSLRNRGMEALLNCEIKGHQCNQCNRLKERGFLGI